jgi:hypothetical protein
MKWKNPFNIFDFYTSIEVDDLFVNYNTIFDNYYNKTVTNSTGIIGLQCNDGEILEFDSTLSLWECGIDSTGTDTNAATICDDGQYLDGDGTCKTLATIYYNANTNINATGYNISGDTITSYGNNVASYTLNITGTNTELKWIR